MEPRTNWLVGGIIAALLSLIALFTWYQSGAPIPVPSPSPSVLPSPSPSVSPSPSPTVSPVPSPKPSPTVSPSPVPSPTNSPTPIPTVSPTPVPAGLVAVVGEVVSYEFVATQNVTLAAVTGLKLNLFQKYQVQTTTPSFKGAALGMYDDPLVPVASAVAGKSYWLDITAQQAGSFQIPALGLAVTVKPNQMSWKLPFYSELTFQVVSQAHGLADTGTTLAARGALNAQYRALLRAHGVEPVKQGISLYPTADFTQPFPGNGVSFAETNLNGAIYPPCLFGPAPGSPPSASLLASLDSAITSGKLPVGTWAYVCDESNCSAGVVSNVKSGAPHLLTMATQLPNSNMGADEYYPVMNFWPWPGTAQGAYVSCMSAGCGNGGAYAPSGIPGFLIDNPRAQLRAFPVMLKHFGIPRGLYYDTVFDLNSAWNPGGQFYSGGNGDGTLLYPGRPGSYGLTVDQPIGSIRLKELRRGLQDVWYWSQGKSFADPIGSTTSYPQTDAGFEAVRLAIWQQL